MDVHDVVLDIDIDGTIARQESEDYGSNTILPGVVDWVNKQKSNGCYIVFRTGRSWDDYNVTREMLDDAGFEYDELICGKPVGLKTIYMDDKEIRAITVKRNGGLSGVQVA